MNSTYVLPGQIEKRSMEIIASELPYQPDAQNRDVILRVIHTTADFDYLQNLQFSPDACSKAIEAFKNGATLITDTNMAKSGVNKAALVKCGGEVECFMADEEVAQTAKKQGTTRAAASMEKATTMPEAKNMVFAVGNAPTALITLCRLMDEGLRPKLIIGVPVGFVNVVESKLDIMEACKRYNVPYIVAKGRKGGSNVAAAICNALLYKATNRTL